jgi:hypothetical protein
MRGEPPSGRAVGPGLRHSFGTLAVQAFPLSDVQAWMGHADIATTMRYVHYVPKHDAAERLGRLLGDEDVAPKLGPNSESPRSSEGMERPDGGHLRRI